MSDLLQRLVKSARGAPEAASLLRIEPLLTPRYAPARVAIGAERLQETHAETMATTSDATRLTPSRLTAHTSPARALLKETILTPEQSARKSLHRADATAANLKPAVEPARTVDMGNDSLRAPSEHAGDGRAESSIKPAPQITVRPSQPSAATRPSVDAPHATPTAVYNTPIIEENTQTITISIGHVEVRNAPAPPPAAPRRPAFRPAVSLDTFLKRGGGDER